MTCGACYQLSIEMNAVCNMLRADCVAVHRGHSIQNELIILISLLTKIIAFMIFITIEQP